MKSLFPIFVFGPNSGGGVPEFQGAFHATRLKGETWYVFDVVIHSLTDVEFKVFDMHDSYYGGKGRLIRTYRTSVTPDITRKAVIRAASLAAQTQRAEELEVHEAEIIASYTQTILKGVYGGD